MMIVEFKRSKLGLGRMNKKKKKDWTHAKSVTEQCRSPLLSTFSLYLITIYYIYTFSLSFYLSLYHLHISISLKSFSHTLSIYVRMHIRYIYIVCFVLLLFLSLLYYSTTVLLSTTMWVLLLPLRPLFALTITVDAFYVRLVSNRCPCLFFILSRLNGIIFFHQYVITPHPSLLLLYTSLYFGIANLYTRFLYHHPPPFPPVFSFLPTRLFLPLYPTNHPLISPKRE